MMEHSMVHWVLYAARVLVAIQFAVAAYYKITLFSMQVAQTAAAGVPLPTIAVGAALVLEVVGVIALLSGYYVRLISVLLAAYVMLLAVIFYHNWSDPMIFGSFVSHLGLTAALLAIFAYSSRRTPVGTAA